MADSTIRLRQLNQAELSGFVSGIFNTYPKVNVSGSIVPSGSGIASLGSSSSPYSKIYTNQINLSTGSGLYFGSTSFDAYTSGGYAYVKVGGITISSSGDGILIAGPSGVQGPSGKIGPTGVSGVGVTGASYSPSTNILKFWFSNGDSSSFNFQGLSGDTGVSVTGFFQSGALIYPQFDHFKGTGAPILLIAGPAGPPGGINLYFEKSGENVFSNGTKFPEKVIIDPYFDSSASPTISFLRGGAYTADFSGLHTYTITPEDTGLFKLVFPRQAVPFQVGDKVNYFKSGDSTGYWRLAFWPSSQETGYYSDLIENYPQIFNETTNSELSANGLVNNSYRTNLSFVTSFTAKSHYKYGFMVYTIDDVNTVDSILGPTGYAYVLGDAYISSGIGPVGPIGPSGLRGYQGNIGPVGPSGSKGDNGAGVVSYSQQVIGPNQYQLQFIFSDGNIGPWVDMPSGGPSGVAGPSGARGGLTNYFSGIYSPSTAYSQNDTVTYSGSSYVYVNVSSSAGNLPTNPTYWQLIAQKGDIGPTGATGISDRYSQSLFVVSGYPTGAGSFAIGITGLTVNGASVSGTGSRFQINNTVSFRNSVLSGYSFSPYQNIVLSTNSYTGTYCYGQVVSFDKTSGILSFLVSSGGTGINNITSSGGYFLWYNWNNATINLGANMVSGAVGPVGPVGPQGAPGTASAMRTQSYICGTGTSLILNPTGLNITGGMGIDCFCVTITGNGIQYYGAQNTRIDFNWSGFQTGQTVILKIRNSGIPDGNGEPPLFDFNGDGVIKSSQIKWPMGIYSRPDDKMAFIYTILRFPDEDNGLSCFGTYSNPYFY